MADAELSGPITLRLPREVLTEIEHIAKISDRTRSWVMVRALRHYLAAEGKEILDVAEGIRQTDAGESADMDDLIGAVEKIVRGNAA